MIDSAFFMLYFAVPLLFFTVLRYTEKKILQFSFFHFVIIAIFITQYLGLLPLYFEYPEQRANIASQSSLILTMWAYTSLSLFGLLGGRYLSRFIVNNDRFTAAFPEPPETASSLKIKCIFVIALCISAFAIIHNFYLNDIDWSFFQRQTSVVKLREAVNFRDLLPFINVNVLFYFLIPLLSLWLYFQSLQTHINVSNALKYSPYLVIALMPAFLSFEKRPILDLILVIMLCFGCVIGQDDKAKTIFKYGAYFFIILLVFSVIIVAFGIKIPGFKPIGLLIDRLVFGQLQSTYLYVEIFPNEHPYLNGASIPFMSKLSDTPIGLAAFVHEYLGLKKSIEPGGSSPTIFWGEIYANFGVIPILFAALFLGLFLEVISYLMKTMSPRDLFIILYIWLGLHYSKIASTSFSTFIFDQKLVYVLIVLLILNGAYSFVVKSSKT